MCEYCENKDKDTENDLRGMDGICFDNKTNSYYIYAEHFRDERIRIDEIEYCPKCGAKLH